MACRLKKMFKTSYFHQDSEIMCLLENNTVALIFVLIASFNLVWKLLPCEYSNIVHEWIEMKTIEKPGLSVISPPQRTEREV